MRIGIGLPAYGGNVCSRQGITWLGLGSILGSHPKCQLAMFEAIDVCGVDRARNWLLDSARKQTIDWLLMIDSDVWIERGDLLTMIEDAESMDASIIGPPVMMRGAIRKPMVYRYKDKGKDGSGNRVVDGILHSVEPGKVSAVDAIGGSCMAISLARTEGCYFAFESNESEDLSFCRQVRERDGKVLVDARLRTCHVDRGQASVLAYP